MRVPFLRNFTVSGPNNVTYFLLDKVKTGILLYSFNLMHLTGESLTEPHEAFFYVELVSFL